MTARPRVAIFADIDPSLVDGSVIWLSAASDYVREAGCHPVLALRTSPPADWIIESSDVLVPEDPLPHPSRPAFPELAGRWLASRVLPIVDLLVVRSRSPAELLRHVGSTGTPVVPYLPSAATALADTDFRDHLIEGDGGVLVQTELSRAAIEAASSKLRGRVGLLPVAVPPAPDRQAGFHERVIDLMYAGKFSAAWGSDQLLEVIRRMGEYSPAAHVVIFGDKIDRSRQSWADGFTKSLEESPHVEWCHRAPRTRVLQTMEHAKLGFCWRTDRMDDSLEVSSKLLEFGSRGVPCVLRPSLVNRSFVGDDYPLFIRNADDVAPTITATLTDEGLWRAASDQIAEATQRRREMESPRIHADFLRQRVSLRPIPKMSEKPEVPRHDGGGRGQLRVVAAGHDFKFFDRVVSAVRSAARVDVDQWQSHARHSEGTSRRLLRRSDVILCEWMLGNAVWYAANRRHQRLIVRIHRQEIETDFPAQLLEHWRDDDLAIVITPWVGDWLVELGFPEGSIRYIPNGVRVDQLRRPKLPFARRTIGMLGWLPVAAKRPSRALELIHALPDDFKLIVKGKGPDELPWLRNRPEDYAGAVQLEASFGASPKIRRDPHGDPGPWFQEVGFILSTSAYEGSHVSVAEAMASGSIPIIFPWHGASRIYPEDFVVSDVEAAAEAILRTSGEPGFSAASLRAHEYAIEHFSESATYQAWWALLNDVARGF